MGIIKIAAMAMAALSAGCMPAGESVSVDVSPGGWNESVELRYSNSDTVSVRVLQLSLLHSASPSESIGRYSVETVSPSGARTLDTLVVAIPPDTRSNRLGESTAPPSHKRLAAGEWRFVVTPLENTTGIWSVSITLSRRNGQR